MNSEQSACPAAQHVGNITQSWLPWRHMLLPTPTKETESMCPHGAHP